MAKYKLINSDKYPFRFGSIFDENDRPFTSCDLTIKDLIRKYPNDWELVEEEKYPKTNRYPKLMLVCNDNVNWQPRVVFMEKCGKFLAWNNAETIEEAENEDESCTWYCAKDIEEPEQVKKMTVAEISKLVGCKVEIVE